MTNKKRIQTMNTEELAFFLKYFSMCECCPHDPVKCAEIKNAKEVPCEKGLSIWLESEESVTKTPTRFLREQMQ